jgi:hypothetical protein
MSSREERSSRPDTIDGELLERMGRIARGLPGHTVSVAGAEIEVDPDTEPPRESGPVLKIDGVVADEILDRCYLGLEAG